jgi:hypothetical protein
MENPFKEKYPLLFRNEDVMEPINLFGIECRKGWDNLLNAAFSTLYSEYKLAKSSLDFWEKLEPDEHNPQSKIDERILDCKKKVEDAIENLPVVDQCKEKFGTLRLYCSNLNDFSRGVIYMAEAVSEFTCEMCGDSGTLSGRRWVSTLCVECTKERDDTLTSSKPVVNS